MKSETISLAHVQRQQQQLRTWNLELRAQSPELGSLRVERKQEKEW